jgi:hypothetical protein
MDATTIAIVNGRLTMPLQSWPATGLHGSNHPSWERDATTLAALGPTLANWLYSGKLEYVTPTPGAHHHQTRGSCPQILRHPPLYLLITDARLGNHIYAPWGSVNHSIDDAALRLTPFDFFFCVDIADAYHTATFAGCGAGIIIEPMTWIDQTGAAHVRNQLFLGCSPRTCSGACDKSLSSICIDGFIFLFACCQFGKATVHDPLNLYILSLI